MLLISKLMTKRDSMKSCEFLRIAKRRAGRTRKNIQRLRLNNDDDVGKEREKR